MLRILDNLFGLFAALFAVLILVITGALDEASQAEQEELAEDVHPHRKPHPPEEQR